MMIGQLPSIDAAFCEARRASGENVIWDPIQQACVMPYQTTIPDVDRMVCLARQTAGENVYWNEQQNACLPKPLIPALPRIPGLPEIFAPLPTGQQTPGIFNDEGFVEGGHVPEGGEPIVVPGQQLPPEKPVPVPETKKAAIGPLISIALMFGAIALAWTEMEKQ